MPGKKNLVNKPKKFPTDASFLKAKQVVIIKLLLLIIQSKLNTILFFKEHLILLFYILVQIYDVTAQLSPCIFCVA